MNTVALGSPQTGTEVSAEERPLTPTQLRRPAFLLAPPFSYTTNVANNVWMEEIDQDEREPDKQRSMAQFLDLYRFVASEALVYLLPARGDCGLQDLVFAANLGVVLDHFDGPGTAVLSNFTSEPRRGETDVGVPFFEAMGYDTFVSPHRFEGDAELKHLHDNVYVGGYGQRSELETYDWMERCFDMEVVRLRHDDPYLYHLDCTTFPLTREETLVCTEIYDRDQIARLEQHTNIIDVSLDACYAGICNSVRLSNLILSSSHIHELKRGSSDYAEELAKNRRLEDIAAERGFEVSFFNVSEYHKGGALLSCMMMHLNRYSYELAIT